MLKSRKSVYKMNIFSKLAGKQQDKLTNVVPTFDEEMSQHVFECLSAIF